jgi:hypothetical protein
MRLNQPDTIVSSLTASANVLREVASDQKLGLILNSLNFQHINLLQDSAESTTENTSTLSLDAKLGQSVSQAIDFEESAQNRRDSRRSSMDSFHSAISSSSGSTSSIVSILEPWSCNTPCHWSGPASIHFTYFAPTWALLKTLNVYVKAQGIHGLDFNIRTYEPLRSMLLFGTSSSLEGLRFYGTW